MMCVCVCTKPFQNQNANYLICFARNVNIRVKLKWGTILWNGGVGCLTPFPHVIELLSPRSLVQSIGLP